MLTISLLLHRNRMRQFSSTSRLQLSDPSMTLLIYPSHTRFPDLSLRLSFPHSSSQNDGLGSHCDSHSSSILAHSGLLSHRVACTVLKSMRVVCAAQHRMKPLDPRSWRQRLWLICCLHSTDKLQRSLSMATHSVELLQCIWPGGHLDPSSPTSVCATDWLGHRSSSEPSKQSMVRSQTCFDEIMSFSSKHKKHRNSPPMKHISEPSAHWDVES